ncbi:MAG TPA: hypothetical protein VGE95_03190 [Arthrobacter sp.]
MSQLARGREWATPGVQAALQRAVAGLDTGIETASPRLQALLRRLAEELAGGVEILTPRVQEQLKRVGTKASAQVTEPVPARAGRSNAKLWWWIGGFVMAAAGVTAWRSRQSSKEEPSPSLNAQNTVRPDPDAEGDLAAGRM